MGMDLFALKGNILYTPQKKELAALPDAYVVCREDFAKEYIRPCRMNTKISVS